MWWNSGTAEAMQQQFDRGIRIGLLSVDLIQINTMFRALAAGIRREDRP